MSNATTSAKLATIITTEANAELGIIFADGKLAAANDKKGRSEIINNTFAEADADATSARVSRYKKFWSVAAAHQKAKDAGLLAGTVFMAGNEHINTGKKLSGILTEMRKGIRAAFEAAHPEVTFKASDFPGTSGMFYKFAVSVEDALEAGKPEDALAYAAVEKLFKDAVEEFASKDGKSLAAHKLAVAKVEREKAEVEAKAKAAALKELADKAKTKDAKEPATEDLPEVKVLEPGKAEGVKVQGEAPKGENVTSKKSVTLKATPDGIDRSQQTEPKPINAEAARREFAKAAQAALAAGVAPTTLESALRQAVKSYGETTPEAPKSAPPKAVRKPRKAKAKSAPKSAPVEANQALGDMLA